MPTPWLVGRFNNASAIVSSSGQRAFAANRVGIGTYNITWTGANPAGGSYAVLVSVRGNSTASYGLPGPTGFEFYNFALASTGRADIPQDASFMTIP